jgi:hypothetical protein
MTIVKFQLQLETNTLLMLVGYPFLAHLVFLYVYLYIYLF